MKGVFLCLAVALVVAQAQIVRDITIPQPTCAPCSCNTTPPCTKPPTRPPKFCPPCVMAKCTPNACDLSVQVPFPGDCTKFCKCEHSGAQEFDCPGGLHFNEALQLCDWPENAFCSVPGTFLGGCEHLAG